MFSILITYVFISNLVFGYEKCNIKDVSTSEFYGNKDTKMLVEENKLESIGNISKNTCMKLCRKHESCMAFSYAHGTSFCTLHKYSTESAGMSLVEAPGVWFYDIQSNEGKIKQSYVGRCSQGHQCRNGGSCVNDCSSKGYFCSCTDLYRGEFCQEKFEHKPILVQTISGALSHSTLGFEHNNVDYLINGGYETGVLAKVFKYNKNNQLYEEYTTLPDTSFVRGMVSFDINGRTFILVPNRKDSDFITTSQLFVINDDTGIFDLYQTFTTYTPNAAVYLEASDGNRYLLIANEYTGSSYSTDSFVFIWDDYTKLFKQIGSLPSIGAKSVSIFEIDNKIYVGIPNGFDNSGSHDNLPYIYKMNSHDSWSLIQSLPEANNGAKSVRSYKRDTETYLLVVRHEYCSQNAIVYKWSRVSQQFEIKQRIPMTDCPYNSEIFEVGGELYFITANVKSDWNSGESDVPNVIYKLEGDVWVKHFTILGSTRHWRTFKRDGESYIMYANLVDKTLKIYQWI